MPSERLRCYAVAFRLREVPCSVPKGTQAHGGHSERFWRSFGATRWPSGYPRRPAVPDVHAGVRKCNPRTFGAPPEPQDSFGRTLSALLRCHALAFGLPKPPCGALEGTQARGSAMQAPSAPLPCHAVAFKLSRAPCGHFKSTQARGNAIRALGAPSVPRGGLRPTQGALRPAVPSNARRRRHTERVRRTFGAIR